MALRHVWCHLIVIAFFLSACSGGDDQPAQGQSSTSSSVVDGPTPTLPSSPQTAPPAADDSLVTEPQGAPTQDELAALTGSIVRRTASGDLVVSDPDGSNELVLASGVEQRLSQPSWSSTASQVAWSAVGPEGPLLLVANADGTNLRSTSVPTPAFYLSWSPDDSWLAGLRSGPAGIELIVIDPATAEVRVVGPGQPFFTDWQRNDALIAAIGGVAIADIPAAGGEPSLQRDLSSPLGVFQAPAVRPNGQVIVALRDGESNVVTELTGIAERRLGVAAGPVVMALNQGGSKLAVFVAADEALSEVISFQTADVPTLPAGMVSIIDLETGDVDVRPETQIGAINWSPDDSTLAMLQFGDSSARWLYATDSGVTSGVSFVPSRELATSYLPFSDQYERSSTWWSPDSAAFVTSGTIDGEEGIWVDLVADNLGPALLGDGDIAFWSPR